VSALALEQQPNTNITRHSHCGSIRKNCKTRKLSRNHRPLLSA